MSGDETVPPQAASPAAPHEGPLERAEDWFREHHGQITAGARDAAAIADELKPLLKGHAAGVFNLAARVFASPELKALEPEILDLLASAVQIAGIAL